MRFRKRIKDINIDLNINTRPLDPGVIEEYAESMERYGVDKWQSPWKEMPKITHDLHLFGGFHTVYAAMQAFGEEHEITFDVEGNTLRDAFFLATEQNAQHGRRRGNAEKRNIVLRWLLDDEMKEWTDGHIADQCQVSQNFVTSISNQLKSDLSGIDFPTSVFSDGKRKSITEYHRPSKRKFIGKGGVQWIETEQIGTKAQLETAKNSCIRAQNAAYDKWHGICGEKAIPFDWDQFVAVASKEMGEFSLPSKDDTTPESVAEKSRQWHRLKDAISHRKRWVKIYLTELEVKAKPRKRLLDEIMKLQIHQVSPLLPEQYRDEWKESKAGLKAAYPLYFSYSNRNNLPIEKLEEMKDTLLRMKKDLQENGIAKFLSDDYKERAAAHGELTQAYHKAQKAFNAHPLAEQMEFDDFEQEAEFWLELEEGLLSPDFVGGLEVKDIRRYKHLWDKIAKGFEQNVSWVQKILGEAEEGKERVAVTETAQASMDAAKESFLENREALGLAEVSWEDFAERARIEFKRRSADTLLSPSDQLVRSRVTPPAKLCYLGSLWERLRKLTSPPAQDWVAEYADEVKRGEIFGEVVSLQSQAQEIWQEDLRGHVYWDAFNEAIAANIDRKLGEPITAAASVEELTEHIELRKRALADLKAPADWVIALKEREKQEAPLPSEAELKNERALCDGHIKAAEHDFQQLQQKYKLEADFQDFYVYACEHFEEERNLDLSRYIEGLRSIPRIAELREMWKTVVDDLGSESDWIKDFVNRFKATEDTSEESTPLEIKPLGEEKEAEAQQKARREMMEVYEKGQAAFKAHPLAKLIDFEEFMTESESHLEEGDMLEPPTFVHDSDAEAYKQLWLKVAEDLNQNTGWIGELLKTFSENEEVEENDESASEQPAALQIEPLGPADADAPEANKVPSINFKDLDGVIRAKLRAIAREANSIMHARSKLPEPLDRLLSQTLEAIIELAGDDEWMKKALKERYEDADTGQR